MVSKFRFSKQHIPWRVTAYSLVLAGFLLRVYRLNDVAVEKAEMTNITWYIHDGLLTVLTRNDALNNHPLNAVLGFLMSALGVESLFTLRWHSVVIGVLTVAVLLRVARDWFGTRLSLVAGLLITVSAYHVTLSQRARSYVGLVGFTLLGFFLLYRAIETGQKRYWLGFVAVSVLNIYAHLYGVMAVGILGVIGVGLLFRSVGNWRPGTAASLRRLAPLVVSLAVTYLLAFALYLPMLPDIVSVAGESNPFRDSDLRHAEQRTTLEQLSQPVYETIRPFSLAEDATRLRLGDPTYHYGPVDRLAVLAEADLGFYLSIGSFLLGLIFAWRVSRWRTLTFAVWLGLPFGLQLIGNNLLPGAYFRGRFLAFIYGPYLLFSAWAWPGLVDWLAVTVRGRRGRILAYSLGGLGLSSLVLLNLAWLTTFYAAAANEDWVGVAQTIVRHRQPGDIVICGQRPKTACNFDLSTRTHSEVKEFANLVTLENLRANRAGLEQPGRVWVVMPHLLPWQTALVQKQLAPEQRWLAGNPRYDQVGWWVIDSADTLGDNLAAALALGTELSLDREEKFWNTISLAQLHVMRDQPGPAERHLSLASALLPAGDTLAEERLRATEEQLQYARQLDRSLEQVPTTATRLARDFEGLARLVGYQVEGAPLTPGRSIEVKLYWQPLTRMERNLVSYVHLTDLKANLIGQAEGIPAGGQAPTPTWQPGQLVVDTYTITIPPDTPAPLAVRLEAGLFAPADYEFIQAMDGSARPTDPMIAGLTIVPPEPPTGPDRQLEASFDGLIRLLGYDLGVDPLGLTLYWQAQTDMDEDYTVFIHFLDAQGQLAGQLDGQPSGGNYPTSWWSPGEIVSDTRSGVDLPAGRYQVKVGWYRAGDGTRLPLVDGAGDSVSLGVVEVEEVVEN